MSWAGAAAAAADAPLADAVGDAARAVAAAEAAAYAGADAACARSKAGLNAFAAGLLGGRDSLRRGCFARGLWGRSWRRVLGSSGPPNRIQGHRRGSVGRGQRRTG
jgi:hypothetical protein